MTLYTLPGMLDLVLATLRRDLRTLTQSLFGARRPAATPRVPLHRHGHVIDPLGARVLELTEVVRETPDAVTLRFAGKLAFTPGQFLTLLVELDGATHRRAYSLCTTPSEGVAVTVKRTGKISNHLNDHARAGDRVRVLGPSGTFGLAPDPSAARHVLLVAGGSGITPLYAIAKAVLADEPGSTVTLLYANRAPADVIFARGLDELAARHGARLAIHHVYGVFAPAALAPLVRADSEIYSCGPAPMMALVREALPGRVVHEERFTAAPAAAATTTARGPQLVTVKLRGGEREVVVSPEQTILDAALEAGVALPFSCSLGGCGACKVKLVAGEVVLDEPHCLSDVERARGEILTCVARACTPLTLSVEQVA